MINLKLFAPDMYIEGPQICAYVHVWEVLRIASTIQANIYIHTTHTNFQKNLFFIARLFQAP
jgi:thymidine kinase